MISEDYLWEFLKRKNIPVFYRNLRDIAPDLYGCYVYDPDTRCCAILLDKSLLHQPRLHKCVLAEELGHYQTSPQGNLLRIRSSYNLRIVMSKDERRALKWATDFLIPDSELVAAHRTGLVLVQELADYFDVTEWFVWRKLEFWSRKVLNRREVASYEKTRSGTAFRRSWY